MVAVRWLGFLGREGEPRVQEVVQGGQLRRRWSPVVLQGEPVDVVAVVSCEAVRLCDAQARDSERAVHCREVVCVALHGDRELVAVLERDVLVLPVAVRGRVQVRRFQQAVLARRRCDDPVLVPRRVLHYRNVRVGRDRLGVVGHVPVHVYHGQVRHDPPQAVHDLTRPLPRVFQQAYVHKYLRHCILDRHSISLWERVEVFVDEILVFFRHLHTSISQLVHQSATAPHTSSPLSIIRPSLSLPHPRVYTNTTQFYESSSRFHSNNDNLHVH
mmetsp:Transcript_11635/g.21823  ORF Transcript_11635/g.21823 Transcript_11635/m.21823 type:complete len:272 (-) Transcript_11635:201-1016(-)